MSGLIAIPFIIFFAGIWTVMTTVLASMSGSTDLAARYPNRDERPLATFNGQSAMMGKVSYRGVLNFAICPSGLRIGVMRLFGPFAKPSLVPWRDITVERSKKFLIGPVAVLRFGGSDVGKLTIAGYLADRLARASGGSWPEPGPWPAESAGDAFLATLREWAIATGFAATFFIVVPRIASPHADYPPIPVAIAFPAVVFGAASIFRYFGRIGR